MKFKKSSKLSKTCLGFLLSTTIIGSVASSISIPLTDNQNNSIDQQKTRNSEISLLANQETNKVSLSNDEISNELKNHSKNTYKNIYFDKNNSITTQETLMTNVGRKLQFRAQNWLMQQGNDRKYYSSLLNQVSGISTLNFNYINFENELLSLFENAIKSVWPTYKPTDVNEYFYQKNPVPHGGAGYTDLIMRDGWKKVQRPNGLLLTPGYGHLNGELYYITSKNDVYKQGDANDCWGKTLYSPNTKSVVNIGRQTVSGNGLIDSWDWNSGTLNQGNDLTETINDIKNNAYEKENFYIKNSSLKMDSLFFKLKDFSTDSFSGSSWRDGNKWVLKIFDNTDNSFFNQSNWNNLYGSMQYTNLNKWFSEDRNNHYFWTGNQNTTNRIDSINVDFSKLIEIDLEKTSSYYTNDNKVHKDSPKIYFGWNNQLMNALYEAYELANIVIDICENFNSIQATSKYAYEQIFLLLNDIYNQRTDLNKVKNYLNQIKNSDGMDWYYQTASPTYKATWSAILDKYNWNFNQPTITLVNPSNCANVVNQIMNWKVMWDYCLPVVFSNVIYCEIKSTGNDLWIDKKSQTKLFDGNTKKFVPLSIPNYGQQSQTHNNDVEIEIRNIYMYNPSANKRIAGFNTNNQTLKTNNIWNETDIDINVNKNISFNNANNSIKFNFAYNPQLQNVSSVETDKNTKALINIDAYFTNFYLNDVSPISNWDIQKEILLSLGLITMDEIANNPTAVEERIMEFLIDPIIKPPIDIDVNDPKWINYPELVLFEKEYAELMKKFRLYETGQISDSEFLKARKRIDGFGYCYLEMNTDIPLDYFLDPLVYKKLIEDRSIIFDKDYTNPNIKMYKYYVKATFNYLPLEIDNLDQYLTINYSNSLSQIDDIKEVNTKMNDYENDLFDIQKDFINKQNQFKQIQLSIEELDNWLTSEINKFLEENPDLNNQYNEILKECDSQINAINKNIQELYKKFEDNNDWESKGFILELYKEFDYQNLLNDLRNAYLNKIDLLNKLFEDPKFDKLKSTLNTKTIKIKNEINFLISEIQSNILTIENISTDIKNQINFLKSINYLDYEDQLIFTFDTTKMQKDSCNHEASSYHFIAQRNEIYKYFYVTKEDFVAKLNHVIQSKYNFNPNIKVNQFFGYDWEKPNEIYNDLDSLGDGSIYTFNYNQTTEEEKRGAINKWIFKYTIKKTTDINIQDSKTRANQVLSQKELVRQAKQILDSSLAKANKNIDLSNLVLSYFNDLKNIATDQLDLITNSDTNFFPNSQEINKALNTIDKHLASYQNIVVKESKINPTALGLTIGFSIVGIILLIGLIFFIKSKRKPKFKEINKDDENAMVDFMSRQGVE